MLGNQLSHSLTIGSLTTSLNPIATKSPRASQISLWRWVTKPPFLQSSALQSSALSLYTVTINCQCHSFFLLYRERELLKKSIHMQQSVPAVI